MKGLIKTSIIIAALIGVSIVTSIIITSNLSKRVVATHEPSFEAGRTQGYEVGFHEGNKAGYQEGSKIGYEKGREGYDSYNSDEETGFYFTYNPTYDELQAILAESNKTTAMEVNNFAEANGIRTAYVRCQIARKTAERTVYVYHLVAFETVDRGFIFIRPRSHEEIKVEVGKSYSELNGFSSSPYDDTITKITIVW
ncbi:hypothetical protein ES703_93635 [subsurface metagenome]